MKVLFKIFGLLSALACVAAPAYAMDLDWSGQFRAEANFINNYAPPFYNGTGDGYQIQPAGSQNARFQDAFLRLTPKLIVNDNVVFKSEWWLGNPVTGFYGSDFPGSNHPDQSYYNSTYSSGSTITAQRYWAEFLTDLGTLQVGRAPQNWGLGLIHNAGDGLFDRYQSTGDTITMVSKFGNFALIPGVTKYDMGNAVGGTCVGGNTTCAHPEGGAGLSEYTVGLQYNNPDEDFEGGVELIRRIAGAQAEADWINGSGGGMNVTIWDIYAKKKMGKFAFGLEAPIFNGDLEGYQYKAFALAAEAKYRANDTWSFSMKAGKVPGQEGNPDNPTPTDKWSMVYFHPNYRLGLLMFNYNFAAFAGNNNANTASAQNVPVQSIYDNSITNANYLMLGTALTADKWVFSGSFITANANETAQAGEHFFNSSTRTYSAGTANYTQGSSLGTEVDLGAALNWDEFTTFALDFGFLWQGSYYEFGNGTANNSVGMIFGAVGSVGVKF